MYCPNCGNKTSDNHKFCRSCGLGLDKIALSVAEQLPSKMDENLQAQKNKFERLGTIALGGFGVIVGSFLIYLLFVTIYKMILTDGKVFEGIGLLAVIVCVLCGLLAVYLFARASELETSTARQIQPLEETSQSNTTSKLLPEAGLSIESVTERTTELMVVENKEDTGVESATRKVGE